MDSDPGIKYRRILLKLSGEALAGDKPFGIDSQSISSICNEISEVKNLGVEIGIVVGGGNIFRGLNASGAGMDRVTADNMGMLATVINALAIMDHLENISVKTRVMSAINIESFAEPYIRRRAIRHMEKGRVIVLAAGTGNPYFTTDTAASLRAKEIGADILLKGTKVDGVYSEDPMINPDAEFYENVSYMDVVSRELGVMDLTAITMCKDNNIPVIVFNMKTTGSLKNIVLGKKVGTLVSETHLK